MATKRLSFNKRATNLIRSTLSRSSIRKRGNTTAISQELATVEIESINEVENVVRKHHTVVDPLSPLGYYGLPPKVAELLLAEGFTKEDLGRNLNDAVEIASLHIDGKMLMQLEEMERHAESTMADIMANSVSIQKTNPKKKYQFDASKDFLGKGSFGKVVMCKKKGTREEYAMKCLRVVHLDKIEHEVQMHALCGEHPNVVHLEEAFLYNNEVFVVLEYMESGSISKYLSSRLKWKEKAVNYVIYEALKGLAFMHSHNHLHRDIKSDNILINAAGDVKLADFGFATNLTKESDYRKTMLGTPHWMAPEVALRKPYDSKSDVWSLGITLYDIAHGLPPYSNEKPLKAIFLIRTAPPPRMKDPSRWTPEFLDVVEKMLEKDPAKRSSSLELLGHNVFLKESRCTKKEFSGLLRQILEAKKKLRASKKKA